jgi:hypothetical protein
MQQLQKFTLAATKAGIATVIMVRTVIFWELRSAN